MICIVRIDDIDDLVSRADQPSADLFTAVDSGSDRIFLVGHQHVAVMIRQVVRHRLFVFDLNVFGILVRQSAQDEETLTVVHDCREVAGSQRNFLGDDSGIDPDRRNFLGDLLHIIECQDRTHEIGHVLEIDIVGQNTTLQSQLIRRRYFHDRRMREDMSEREGLHVRTLDQVFSHDVSFRLFDLRTGFEQNGSVCFVDIFRQNVMFDTVDDVEFLSQLVSAGSGQIVFLLIEELGIHQVGCTFHRRDFILFLVLVHFQKCRIHRLGLVCLQRICQFLVSTEERCVYRFIDVQELTVFVGVDEIIIYRKIHGTKEGLDLFDIKTVFSLFQVQREADTLQKDRR